MNEHSPGEIGGAVERVFSDPAYIDEARSVEIGRGLAGFLLKLRQLYLDFMEWLKGALDGEWRYALYLLGVLLAILFGYLLFKLARAVLSAPPAVADEGAASTRRRERTTSGQFWERAQALAGQGAWAEALRHLVLTLAAHLRADRKQQYSPAWTNHELEMRLHLRDDEGRALARLVNAVDRAYYGEGEASPEEFREGCALVSRVAGLAAAGSAGSAGSGRAGTGR